MNECSLFFLCSNGITLTCYFHIDDLTKILICKQVCCKQLQTNPDPPPVTQPPPPSGGGEKLLPTNCGHPFDFDRIIFGEQASLGAYPWMAALGYEGKILFCYEEEISLKLFFFRCTRKS